MATTSEAAMEQLRPGTTLEGSKGRPSVERQVDHVDRVDRVDIDNAGASVSSHLIPSWQVNLFVAYGMP
jgi:hypothetical protein